MGRSDQNASSPVPKNRHASRAVMDMIHQDSDLFIIDKPAGMPPGNGSIDDPGVIDAIKGMEGDNASNLRSAYPLDQDISGLMVWTRNDDACHNLSRQFDEQRMTVTFLAVVRAPVMTEGGTIEYPLLLSRSQGGRVSIDDTRGQPAITEWHLRDRYVGFALLECVPRTSICGQIRAHLQVIGMPLAVDRTYGGAGHLMLSSFKANYRRSHRRPERPLIQRPTLHAWRIALEHSRSGEPMQFEAPLPKDLRATVHQLDRFGRIPK